MHIQSYLGLSVSSISSVSSVSSVRPVRSVSCFKFSDLVSQLVSYSVTQTPLEMLSHLKIMRNKNKLGWKQNSLPMLSFDLCSFSLPRNFFISLELSPPFISNLVICYVLTWKDLGLSGISNCKLHQHVSKFPTDLMVHERNFLSF